MNPNASIQSQNGTNQTMNVTTNTNASNSSSTRRMLMIVYNRNNYSSAGCNLTTITQTGIVSGYCTNLSYITVACNSILKR